MDNSLEDEIGLNPQAHHTCIIQVRPIATWIDYSTRHGNSPIV
jgi:hypothetical protein